VYHTLARNVYLVRTRLSGVTMVQYASLVVPLVVVTAMGATGAYFTWTKRDTVAEAWMTGVFLCIAAWAAVHAVLLASRTPTLKHTLLVVSLPIGVALPAVMLAFTLHYTGRKSLVTRPRLVALWAYLAGVVVLGAVNPNDLVFEGLDVVERGGVVSVVYDYGPLAKLIAFSAHLMAIASIYMLFLRFLRSRDLYRKLSFLLFVTTSAMLVATVTTFLGFSPFPHMVLLPLIFLIFGTVSVATTISVRVVQLAPIDRLLSALSGVFGSLVPLARDVVIEELQSGVVVLDDDDRVVDVNAKGKAILAPDGRRVVGQRVTDVVDERQFTVDGTHVFASGTTGRFEAVWVATADGAQRCYDISVSPVSSDDGDGGGRVALLHDVTDQQRRKRELRQKNERLDDFADIVSHDLRNPINVAEGYLDMLEVALDVDDPDDLDLEALATHVEEVRASHDRIGQIIDDVLVLAREGDVAADPEPVAVAALVREAWDNVDTRMATLDCQFDEGTTVRADRSSLLRAVENLLRNAIDHGGTDVTVRVGELDDSPGIYVEDSGPGLPEDAGDELFDHGYTTAEDGTGFGLAIVADVVRGHGWTVDATNGSLGGARFEIETGDCVDPPDAPARGRGTG